MASEPPEGHLCGQDSLPRASPPTRVDARPPTHYYRQPMVDTSPRALELDPAQSVEDTTQGSGPGSLEEPRSVEQDFESTSMTSPIRRLPPELLTEIFLHCLPGTQFVQPHPDEGPLLLTKICSWWRCVCISSPELWSSLELVYKVCDTTSATHWHDPKKNTEALADLWLSRSGDCPLSLSIQDDALLVNAVQKLLNSDTMSRRLQHLKVEIPRRTYSGFCPRTRYPNLVTVDIHSPHGLTDPIIRDISTVFSNAPSLRNFTWANKSFIASLITVQWSALSLIHLTAGISMQNCLDILEASTNACFVHLKDIYLDLEQPPSRQINLPLLDTFVIASRVNISQIFECLTVPNLKTLMITFPAWQHETMMDFIQRSRFALANLDLFYPPISEAQTVEVLTAVESSLEELTLQTESHVVTDSFLERFSPSTEQKPFCPRLSSIALYDCVRCTPGALVRMVESRMQPSPHAVPLRVVELLETEKELRGLVPLRKMGMDVVVYSEATGSLISDDAFLLDLDDVESDEEV